MKIMDELQKELQELINLAPELDDAQKTRLAELPNIIAQAGNAALLDKSKDFDSAVAQKEHFREKFEKSETEKKALEAKLNTNQKQALDVGDYINISASLGGLDSREQEYLAEQHTLSGKPLNEIRSSEDFTLWQSAYREKVEKEKLNLKPSNRQSESEEPITLEQALTEAKTDKEREDLLATHMGYSVGSRPRGDKVNIGSR